MKINCINFLLIINFFITDSLCYLRRNILSPNPNYIFPKTVKSINPYILSAKRHVNVIPTIESPLSPESIKIIKFGIEQSRMVDNKLKKEKEKCNCEDKVYQLD